MNRRENYTEAAWVAMGKALLRVVKRTGQVLEAEAENDFLAAMKTMAASDVEKSVCATLPDEVKKSVHAWERSGLLRHAGVAGDAPFVLDEHEGSANFYTSRQFAEESELAALLVKAHELVGGKTTLADGLARGFQDRDAFFFENTRDAQNDAKRRQWLEGIARQRQAIERALEKRFSVITGGPGTGKTSTVVRILSALLAQTSSPMKVVLTAPTGKAAGRMREAVQKECEEAPDLYRPVIDALNEGRIAAQTIHRLLITPGENGEKPSASSPLSAEILVVDEASMIDQRLALRLLRVTDCRRTRLVFLGDKYQLAAVGPGSVFADITNPDAVLKDVVTEFTYSFRFGDDSPIGCAARAVNKGDVKRAVESLPHVTEITREIVAGDAECAHLAIPGALKGKIGIRLADWIGTAMSAYLERVKARMSVGLVACDLRRKFDDGMLNEFNRFRILCAQREGKNSVSAANDYMEALVREAIGVRTDDVFYTGRIVIVRANDRTTELFNGDVGVVTLAENGKGHAVYFGDNKYVPAALLPAHDTGFSLTVHQSQGSQYASVAVVLPDDAESPLTTRELLYTGITRARKSVVVFASPSALERAVATPVRRQGGLGRRLTELLPGTDCHQGDMKDAQTTAIR